MGKLQLSQEGRPPSMESFYNIEAGTVGATQVSCSSCQLAWISTYLPVKVPLATSFRKFDPYGPDVVFNGGAHSARSSLSSMIPHSFISHSRLFFFETCKTLALHTFSSKQLTCALVYDATRSFICIFPTSLPSNHRTTKTSTPTRKFMFSSP